MKKILSLVLTLAMLCTMCIFTSVSAAAATQWNGEAATEFAGGDGSKNNPYKIGTAGELKLFANIVNGNEKLPTGFSQKTDACAELTADIVLNTGTFTVDSNGNPLYNGAAVDASVNEWFPIGYLYDTDGNGSEENVYYGGTFNGNGHTVSGLYFNKSQIHVGLFGQINGAELSNLGVVNSYIKGNAIVGGVCGSNGGTIANCFNTGTISSTHEFSSKVGGVCGYNAGTVTGCYNTGIAMSVGSTVGGVCGFNVGGTITNCYNIGTVGGESSVGGVCGNDIGTITNCYYLDTCAAVGTTFDSTVGTSKTSEQMKTQDFVNLLNANGGKFTYYIGRFPFQSWQPDPNIYGTAVTYTVESIYYVDIPAEVTLGSELSVSASGVILEEGKQLEVALTATSEADDTFKVTNGGNGVLTYEVKNGETPVQIGDTVLTVNPSTEAEGSTILNFNAPTDTPKYSGEYSGTVTFTVSVGERTIR